MKNQNIKEIIIKFCDMMLEKQKEVQFVKVRIGMKDKSEVKFKKFREK